MHQHKSFQTAWTKLKKNESFAYKPIISRRGWWIIFAAITCTISWLISNDYAKKTTTNFDFNLIKADRIFDLLSRFHLPGMTTNIVLLAMAMMFIQIILLKGYLDKRFEK